MAFTSNNNLENVIEQYLECTSIGESTKMSSKIEESLKDITLIQLLGSQGIFFKRLKNDDSFDYELILPTTIYTLNKSLNLSDRYQIIDGINMYSPPAQIIDILHEDALNSGLLCIEELGNKISLKSKNYGHAIGFLRFYSKNMIQQS